MPDPQPPPQSVLDAFNISTPLLPLPGGRGLCFHTPTIVLRPIDNPSESTFLTTLLLQLSHLPHANSHYRIAQPLLPAPGSSPSWSAAHFVTGRAGPRGNWDHLLAASRAFHADLRAIVLDPPGFIAARTDRWAEADRVTWGEKTLAEVPGVDGDVLRWLDPYLVRLKAMMKPLPEDAVRSQLVHADLTGNVLFDEEAGLAPAIIDLTVYWRPVEFAEAVVVADGLVDYGEGRELVELYGMNGVRLQVLVRALYWRILTLAIQTDRLWLEENKAGMDLERAVGLVYEIVTREGEELS